MVSDKPQLRDCNTMIIYGAGIAGLLAGCTFQTAKIFEAGPENNAEHKALLRFRSTKVADAVGIDFRRVRVHKGIWCDGRFVEPNILLSNIYSQKVIGRLADRSIWNLDPVDRFIAPEDFIFQLAERCRGRIEWSTPVDREMVLSNNVNGVVAVSTLPMPVMAKLTDRDDAPKFTSAGITVKRWRVPGADVFQTVYFPEPSTTLYRASITGDLLIAEYAGEADQYPVWEPFGLTEADCSPIEKTNQRFGKIAPIDNAWRKQFIFDLTTHYNIFSLGRFGTWRNLLLDDVIDDVNVIKKLMNSSGYERKRQNMK